MSDRMTIGQYYPTRIPPVKPSNEVMKNDVQSGSSKSFKEVFQEKFVKFSHHAELRLQQRGIKLQAEQLAKLEVAIDKAADKGAKDALVLLNDMALIVNIQNRTVITAMDGASMKDNVFTQIDSAVIVS